jgi:hypothetical protein
MAQLEPWTRGKFDRIGLALSALCVVHCVLSIVLVAGLGMGAAFLLNPAVHKVGLALAILVACIAIGIGAARHRRRGPVVIAAIGLSLMAGALSVGHGVEEAVLTIAGVALVAAGHVLNLRRA